MASDGLIHCSMVPTQRVDRVNKHGIEIDLVNGVGFAVELQNVHDKVEKIRNRVLKISIRFLEHNGGEELENMSMQFDLSLSLRFLLTGRQVLLKAVGKRFSE